MLYIEPVESKQRYKIYKVLKQIPYNKKVEIGDVIISELAEQDNLYPSSEEDREYLFSLNRDHFGDYFDEWFEEIDYAYFYDSKEQKVRSLDIEELSDLDYKESKKCFADEDKALDLMLEDMGKELPKNLEFKTFISSYIPNLGNNPQYSPEPLEIVFEETRFLLAIDWYRNNIKELEKFLSKEVFNSYVQKIWLNQEDNRIGVTLTSSKYRD